MTILGRESEGELKLLAKHIFSFTVSVKLLLALPHASLLHTQNMGANPIKPLFKTRFVPLGIWCIMQYQEPVRITMHQQKANLDKSK